MIFSRFLKLSWLNLDNFVFRLHYQFTFGLLLACAVVLIWKINFGDPINCYSREVPSQLLNDHCWYYGTKIPRENIQPDTIFESIVDDSVLHGAHRWIVIAVLVQAAFFCIPRIIWTLLEDRRVESLVWNMSISTTPESLKKARRECISNFFRTSSCKNFFYVVGYFFSEILNLLNVLVQLFLVCHILQLPSVSLDLFVLDRYERDDASAMRSFPITTTCTLKRFGPSGSVQLVDATCLMTINGVIEALFFYQWIWFVLLAALSVFAVLYTLMTMLVPHLRVLRLSSKASLTDRSTVDAVVRRMDVGEWFLLYLVSSNTDPVQIKAVMDLMCSGMFRKEEN